ncbi:DeoR/GlpR family DNA-binding transcription regulator [Thermaerobacter subterraneus]|uniref:Lactose phosphotransferase system repressor n=1 Tax=Thermaerobacter subterraneus DSM 13965 TaxID=867903 RepID=K6Q1V9_9FIRM|nr:DeoR/GlpR family DNA-binding transcription regulator [Thermaerobacter subterraneus]EKP95163.1 transcriptional regulator of sugar metabolism [Thermaerobacter subterraneus DSM 13965]
MPTSSKSQAILEHVRRVRFATVAELSASLGVSAVTVRRYLAQLEEQGLLTRTRGGAIAIGDLLEEPALTAKEGRQAEEKQRIAAAAVSMINDGDVIALNAGSTTAAIARLLTTRREITVVTNSLPVIRTLAGNPDIRMLIVGGQLRNRSLALVGPLALQNLADLFVDKAFLGVDGISVEHGITTPNLDEAVVNRTMLRRARKVIVVADHTKFGRVSLSRISSIEEVHTVITDQLAPADAVACLRQLGKEVVLT